MKIRIKSNYLTRYVLQDYGNKEALLPFFVCLVSVYLFFRSFAFFFLCQFTVWRNFVFCFSFVKSTDGKFVDPPFFDSLEFFQSLCCFRHFWFLFNIIPIFWTEKSEHCMFVWFGQKIVTDQVDLLLFAATLTNYIENESIRYAYGML